MTLTVEAKGRIAGVLCALAICAGLLMMAASQAGCGTSLAKQLNGINDGVSGAMQQAHAKLEVDEIRAIEACKKAGGMKPPADLKDLDAWAEQCPGFKKIWSAHKIASDVARGIHVAVNVAAMYLAAKNEKGARDILNRIIDKAIPQLKDALQNAGFLELVGL